MTDTPKLKPWVVALSFQPAPLWLRTVFAAEKHDATALAVFQCMRANPGGVGELASIIAVEVLPEWLRSALRVAEGGAPEGAAVLSLVPQTQDLVHGERQMENPAAARHAFERDPSLANMPYQPGDQIIDPQLPPGAA